MVYAYPKLGQIASLKPNPSILLGHPIFWTVKLDGSNIGCYLDENDEVQLRSRNQDIASPEFYHKFVGIGYLDDMKELLLSAREYGDEYVVFGELLSKGKSPTRITYHGKDDYHIFDIYSVKSESFLPYQRVHQEAFHANIPIVELVLISRLETMEHLYETRDSMLEMCKELKYEGVVGKIFSGEQVFFKEKLDSVHYDKVQCIDDGCNVVLPVLPDSEVYGAIDKVLVDIGTEQFRDVKIAMPMIANYVAVECRKHHCANVRNLFGYYKQKLEDLL